MAGRGGRQTLKYLCPEPALPHSNGSGFAFGHRIREPPCGADSCRRHSAPLWLKLGLPAPAAAPSESAAGCRRIAGPHTHTQKFNEMILNEMQKALKAG